MIKITVKIIGFVLYSIILFLFAYYYGKDVAIQEETERAKDAAFQSLKKAERATLKKVKDAAFQ